MGERVNPQQLIVACQGLVRSLAFGIHRGLPGNMDLDDLIGYGQVGLAEAARDFDESRGGKFSTYAFYRIRGAILDGVARMSWLSRSQYRQVRYAQRANDLLAVEEDESGATTGDLDSDVHWLKRVTGRLAVVYLATLGSGLEDGESPPLEDPASQAPSAAVMQREVNEALHTLIDQLPPEAATLIKAAYFEGLTLTEAGARLGVSKAWASRLHAKTLERLARGLRQMNMSD